MNIRLVERLGRGANGTVYHGVDEDLDRDVAVKFFDNSFESVRLQVDQHAAALKRIAHQNVVAIHGVAHLRRLEADETAAPELALVMEYVPGTSFGGWLALPGKSLDDLERVATGLLDGVEAFHEQGLAHGDLHQANVHISAGIAKILDPMEHDPVSVRTTTLNRDAQARDARSALDLLRQAGAEFGLPNTAMEDLRAAGRPVQTIKQVRERFARAIERARSGEAEADPSRELYRRCRRAQDRGSTTRLQELWKACMRDLEPRLAAIRDGNWRVSQLPAERHALMHKGLSAIADVLAFCLAAAESADRPAHSGVLKINRVLHVEWPESGQSVWVNFPKSMYFCAAHFVGAAAVLNGNSDVAIGLARHVPPQWHERHAPLWRRSDLIANAPAIDLDPDSVWRFLRDCYSAIGVLRDVFATEMDFRIGLHGFNLILSLCEFVSLPEERYRSAENMQMFRLSPEVPPHWLEMTSQEFVEVWSTFEGSRVAGKLLQGAVLSGNAARELWPIWVRTLIGVRESGRAFFGASIPDWISHTLPGDPVKIFSEGLREST